MIKYIGSKRRLVPAIASIAAAVETHRALDLFTGTTRVAQALKQAGAHVTAVDSATYSHVLAQAYVATDAAEIDRGALAVLLAGLQETAPVPGYVTRVFCEQARYFHPDNGARIDAIRDAIEAYSGAALYPILLTSLLEAADRVDSTTGLQMAYLKRWAPRALNRLELRLPELLDGPGAAVLGDALEAVRAPIGPVDFAYLDPPYNQHRYFSNYHVWETLVRWDEPEYYGVACKRVDCREPSTHSPFNRRSSMASALAAVIGTVEAELMAVSYNDEAWLSLEDLVAMCAPRGQIGVLAFDSRRYVGAQIGIHNPSGVKVGEVSHLRNTELIVLSGAPDLVAQAMAAGASASAAAASASASAASASAVGAPTPATTAATVPAGVT
ncbi:MAG: DNA adenine methylase [Acidimicrobiales bacterium]